MLYVFICLADIVGDLRLTLSASAVALAVIGIIPFAAAMMFIEELDDEKKKENAIMKVVTIFKKLYSILLIMFLLSLFIPSKIALYQIAGVYCGKQINQSIHIDKKLQKVSDIIDLQLEKSIKELNKSK